MISEEESIPQKSWAYRIGEDIFYFQFNDVSFYIEDDNQENFYYCILKNLFPTLQLSKIFPLGGKDNVISQSQKNKDNPKKVYIVDKDYDDILGQILNISNLFYLKRYSIENYLIEEKAFIEYIVGERPRIDKEDVTDKVEIEELITEIGKILNELVHLHILVQLRELPIKNTGQNHEKFVSYDGSFSIREEQLEEYREKIENELKKVDGRFTVSAQMKKVKQIVEIDGYDQYVREIPGKYLMKMLKRVMENEFGLNQRQFGSFNYRIAEKCEFRSLNYLKVDISQHLNLK